MIDRCEEDDHKVTLGEVYRLVCNLKDEQGDKLDAIEHQVRIANGRTTRLETQMELLNRERDVKVLPVVVPTGESLSIQVSAKMWAGIMALVSSLAVFGPMLGEWIKALFGK